MKERFVVVVCERLALRTGAVSSMEAGTASTTHSTYCTLLFLLVHRRTSDLIPLCHPLPLNKVDLDIELLGDVAVVRCECRVTHKTGVEMEALVGASVAALTIYDMTKAVSHRIRIEDTVLLSKSGGKRTV